MTANEDIQRAVVTAIDHYMPVHRISEDVSDVEIDSWSINGNDTITVEGYDGDEDIVIHITVTVERGL